MMSPLSWTAPIELKPGGGFYVVDGGIPATMQALRQRGGGPKFVRISCRCIRYRRADLREWAEARLRKSTADTGEAA